MATTAEYLVRYLERCGVKRAYCVPGESYLPVLDAFIDSPIELITCYHESSAGFMAVADGRVTGIPGICLTSRGPGATNAAIALHTAEQDGVPLIMFVGQVPRKHLRRESFQEIDYGKMYGSICKWVVEISDPERLPEALGRAFHVAMDATPGPVVVVLPEDMLEDQLDAPQAPPPRATLTAPSPEALVATRELLASAERPLILAGGQLATSAGRDALQRFAESWRIPVVVTFRRHDLFDNSHELYAGDLGVSNTPAQMEDLAKSDLILALGTRLGDLSTHGYSFPRAPWPGQKLVHVCADPRQIGTNYHPDIAAACSATAFIEGMNAQNAAPASEGRAGWIDRLAAHRKQISTWLPRQAEDGIVFGNVVAALARHLPADGVVTTDAGTSAAQMYRYFPFRPTQRLLATVTGCMGFGCPGSIAIAMNHPGRKVVCVMGDGGFLMTSHELAIAVERRVPVVFLLANNRALGSIRAYQERVFPGRKSATDLTPPDFQLFAKAHGCPSLLVEREEDVQAALARAMDHNDGPLLVEFKTSLGSIVPKAT